MMEDNFRNTLIIISAVIIAAIFIHGLWTIRKNKNPYKLKTTKTKVEPMTRDFDNSGFDQDGVGQVKVLNPTALTGEIDNPPADEEIPHQPAPAPEYSEEPIPSDIQVEEQKPALDELELAAVGEPQNLPTEVSAKEGIEAEVNQPAEKTQPVYQEPVIQAKPQEQVNAAKSKAKTKKQSPKRNQFELNFDDMDSSVDSNERQEPVVSEDEAQQGQENAELPSEVIVVSVVMQDEPFISGAALLPSLLTLGMKFGDMNIFHRHQDNAGNGDVTFSLANMVNPGTFDLDNMENFTTQGVTLFMTLPNAGDPFEVFEQMLSAAKQLSQEFGGQLLDDKRSVMTKQTEQHYVSKIREFERKSRIASS